MRIVLAFLFCAVVALPAWGAGFTGRVDGGVLAVAKADNLWGRGKNHIESIHAKPKTVTHLYPIALVDLRYRAEGSANEFFLSTPPDEAGSVALGLKRTLGFGTATGALFYQFAGSVWENPYVTDREDTDNRVYGVKLGIEDVGPARLGITYRATLNDVDRDLIGELSPDLERDGSTHRLTLSGKIEASREVTVTPSVSYERGAADGESNRYHSGEARLSVGWRKGDLSLSGRVSGSYAGYDAAHPIYDRTREEWGYGAGATASATNVAGLRNVSATLGVIWEQTLANIDFFGTRSTLAFGTIGYSF
ncbi:MULTISPECIES: DUF2860 domain-containing protein [Geobacter]|uniref:DUF2860 domain-containing protein n=1 Tax=Geobacter TaxID=28231 RepID=UPI0025732DCA|nr:DUF2860 domain-containing protein [Geobacter sulfurreducens]BEH11205.1 DUF2860 domain-containing protein [Geobacter sulfurreducens subsp. ethanolicus]BET59055.1 DUF2860 domain-containing protein [Geobacter sp. 60473]